jgi:hypothetical protein
MWRNDKPGSKMIPLVKLLTLLSVPPLIINVVGGSPFKFLPGTMIATMRVYVGNKSFTVGKGSALCAKR